MLSDILIRLRALFRRKAVESELDDEMRFHFDELVEKFVRSGVPLPEARRRARLEFGGFEQVKEECREARGTHFLETVAQDIRYGLRMLQKSPGFTAVVVLTLALGIGANTAIFSVINSALLQPLPYSHPEQLVYVMETLPDGIPNGSVSGGAFKDWRDHSSKFAQLAVYENIERNLTGTATPERVTGWQVSADFLPVLRVVPMLGRGFTGSEAAVGSDNRVVLLAHSFWRSSFGGDARIVGRTVTLDQIPYTVIGVLPPQALLQDDVQFLIPEVIDAPGVDWGRDNHFRYVVGRLLPGVTASEAQTELRGIKQRLATEYPSHKEKWSVSLFPLREIYAGDVRPMFILLLGAVALVLLIACANVSNLLLARGNARSREMAVRIALGAHSRRIVRQMLTESILLAMLGCALGLLFATFGITLLTRMVADRLPQILHPQLDISVLLFSILVASGCGVLFGILPAWRAAKADANLALKDSERGSSSRAKRRSQSLLMVSEFAFTLVLLIGAGLFLRSFIRVLDVDLGFNPKHTLAFDLSFSQMKYPRGEDQVRFTQELIRRIQSLPGVESAGAVSAVPLSGTDYGFLVSRADRPEPRENYGVGFDDVSGDYFSTIGIKLLRGRVITDADNTPGAPPVLVIDSRVARDLFPNENPIGHHLNTRGKSYEIVGVVAPVRQLEIDQVSRPRAYCAQAYWNQAPSIVVRTAVPPSALTETIRKAILEADPDQPIANVRTLEQAVDKSLAPRRMALLVLGLFAAVAVSLACIGIYGVMSYTIGQRARELSIRATLGAQRRDIMRLVLIGGMKPSIIGIVAGLAAALALARFVESQLFGVKAHDPLVFVASVCLLGLVAALSVYFPARRAAKADPMTALRCE